MMDNIRENLLKLVAICPCESSCEGLHGSCPDRKGGFCNNFYKLPYCAFEKLVDHLIAHGVTVQEWIPVTERLPSDEKEVLVYYGFGDLRFMYMGILSYYCFDPNPHWQHEGTGMKIAHWMPVPQPPKGE